MFGVYCMQVAYWAWWVVVGVGAAKVSVGESFPVSIDVLVCCGVV